MSKGGFLKSLFGKVGKTSELGKEVVNQSTTKLVEPLQKSLPVASSNGTTNNYSTEVPFVVRDFKLHNLEEGPATSVTLTKEDALKYYTDMFVIRRLETSACEYTSFIIIDDLLIFHLMISYQHL